MEDDPDVAARILADEMGISDADGLEMLAAELLEAGDRSEVAFGWKPGFARAMAVHLRRMALRARN